MSKEDITHPGKPLIDAPTINTAGEEKVFETTESVGDTSHKAGHKLVPNEGHM